MWWYTHCFWWVPMLLMLSLLHFCLLFLCHHKSKVRNHIIHNPFLSGFYLYYHIKCFSTTVIKVNTSEYRISVLTLFDLEQHPEQWPHFFPLEIWLQWHHTHCFIANSESLGEASTTQALSVSRLSPPLVDWIALFSLSILHTPP